MLALRTLIAEAVALGGGNLCASDHDWVAEGGRPCPRCDDSEPVLRCGRCGEYDYGKAAAQFCADDLNCKRAAPRGEGG